jgi:integrase
MSVRRRGKQFEVRWTEGGRKLSRSFLRAEDARAFDLDIKRKQLGALAPGIIQSRQTLAEFVEEEWWPRYAIPNLAPETRRRYLEAWGVHLLPRLGDYELREITPMVVEDLRDQMTRAKVGAPTQRKALMLLQGILRRAVVRGLLPVNPAQLVDKPKQRPTQLPQPLPPVTVERIRAIMLQPRTRIVPAGGVGKRSRRAYETSVGTSQDRQRNALIVSMLAYAGLRPIEDRGCTWGDLRGPHAPRVRDQDQSTARCRLDSAPGAGPCRVAHGMRPSAG